MSFLQSSNTIHFIEHHHYYYQEVIQDENRVGILEHPICFKNNSEKICAAIWQNGILETNYYIGVDWINNSSTKAIYVQPKLNKEASHQTDYLKMLFTALQCPDVANYTSDLFEIKWDKPEITIEQQQDLLTPLLIVQFLSLVKIIVRKGLKKSYYKVEQNLNSKVKGKVLIGQTIKKNLLNNKTLKTYCSYDEFGLDSLENRLLKKALLFVQRYLPTHKNIQADKYTEQMFHYIMPAFETVSDKVDLHQIKHTKANAFFKEYEEAIKLAKLILKKFGYNITNTSKQQITTAPFWIDMSKLFELYVLGILKLEYGGKLTFQDKANYGYTDFLLNNGTEKIVMDAKYKTQYQPNKIYFNDYLIKDIRQLSGYARDVEVLNTLGIHTSDGLTTVPQCLIIYPLNEYLKKDEKPAINLTEKKAIEQFVNFYKVGVKLPVLSTTQG